ncbi:class F sortase [Streptomyces phaeochromogenes]|uniref:class F sortase n=1 Tax=Streptomyces phaeochromogenes TaxID=1923 RepID=UPI0027D8C8FE|nr:class F sortase [Streptomyces phaeochromogenes]
MAPRRRAPRPWHRTRAYRLTRTAVLAFSLVMGGIWWAEDDGRPPEPAAAPAARPGDATASPGSPAPGPSAAATPEPRRGHVRVPPPVRRPGPVPRPLPRSRATVLRIPYLGLEAPVVGLRLDGKRQLTTPPVDKPELVGWYEGGPSPGEAGTAVVVGHLDTATGPAVFVGLSGLTLGRLVEARRADGRTAVYTVDAVRTYDKEQFPSQEVYGARKRPELRLITCGGAYDRRTGYRSNVVVFAHLTGTREPDRPA